MNTFNQNAIEYDQWFDKHSHQYNSEIKALEMAIPKGLKGIEIGCGTGRFSAPFDITIGIEPSAEMAKIAETRGITVLKGYAENLPLHDERFDFVLFTTTICFLNDVPKALSEAYRVLKKGGKLIAGIIDKSSPLGIQYENKKEENKYYKDANFHTVEELTSLIENAGFTQLNYWQTLIELKSEQIESPLKGHGKGGFVVIEGSKI